MRGFYTNTQGSLKPVGLFVVQNNTITLPANTLRSGSNIDIVAAYRGAATSGTIFLNFGGVQLAAVAFGPGLTNGAVLIRATVNVLSGVGGSMCVFSSEDSGGSSTMGIASFTIPDMTQPIVITVSLGALANFMSVRTYI